MCQIEDKTGKPHILKSKVVIKTRAYKRDYNDCELGLGEKIYILEQNQKKTPDNNLTLK